MGYKLNLNITCPNPKKGATKNIGGLYCLEMYFCQISHTLKTDIFESPEKKKLKHCKNGKH